jgi:hypothetical protein
MYVLNCDFDSPVGQYKCTKTGNSTPLKLETRLTGGDLFMKKKCTWYLIGISAGTIHFTSKSRCGDYGQLDQWARISANHNWIVRNGK